MSCHKIETSDGNLSGWLCLANIFEYKGFVFDFHRYMGPILLRKDLEPAQRIKKGFWDIATEFANLCESEQEKYRIYG